MTAPRTAAGRALLDHLEPLFARWMEAGSAAGIIGPGGMTQDNRDQLRSEIAAIEAEAAAPYRDALAALVAAEHLESRRDVDGVVTYCCDAHAAARKLVEP